MRASRALADALFELIRCSLDPSRKIPRERRARAARHAHKRSSSCAAAARLYNLSHVICPLSLAKTNEFRPTTFQTVFVKCLEKRQKVGWARPSSSGFWRRALVLILSCCASLAPNERGAESESVQLDRNRIEIPRIQECDHDFVVICCCCCCSAHFSGPVRETKRERTNNMSWSGVARARETIKSRREGAITRVDERVDHYQTRSPVASAANDSL